MSDFIQEAQLVTYYLIGYNLHLCKLTKTYLCYFIVKILSKLFCNSLVFNDISWKEGSITWNDQYMGWESNALWALHCSINWLVIRIFSGIASTLLTYS